MNSGESNETDVIQILIRISRRGESTPSFSTLGPWVGPQSAQPSQAPNSLRLKLSSSAPPRKRPGTENQNRNYMFKHFPNWGEYMECYREKYLASSKTSPFETRYVGLPQTFISLPHPEIIRSQARYVEDRCKYPIPIAYDRINCFKTSSTPNLCILPGEGTIQLPPLGGQKVPSMRQDKKMCSPKNLLYSESGRYQKTNYFVESSLQALSTSLDVLKFDPPFDPRFKIGQNNEMKNGNIKPYVVRQATSKKLEKLLVTCQNDSLNLENMIQSLCKSISPDDQGEQSINKPANLSDALTCVSTKQDSGAPATDQLGSSLLNQFSDEVDKVDYDSPLDLQFDGRVYHTNLETFLQCLDTKLHNYSKASIEELMNSIHIHAITPTPTPTNIQQTPPTNSAHLDASSGAGKKREIKTKIMKGGEISMRCKKFPVNMSLSKGKK